MRKIISRGEIGVDVCFVKNISCFVEKVFNLSFIWSFD